MYMYSSKQSYLAALKVASFETNFFRIADTSTAETSVSEKAETLVA